MIMKLPVFFLLLVMCLMMLGKPGVLEAKAVSGGASCQPGWVLYSRDKACYFIQDTSTQHQNNARQHCQNAGADLAIIKSAEQNDFIYNLIRSQITVTKWGAWIGIEKKADGKFYWIDNTPVEGYYSSWAAGEPSGDGNCVQMYGTEKSRLGEKWNDISCQLGSHVTDAPVILCQKPAGCINGTFQHGDSCYLVQDTPTRHQNDAYQHCRNIGTNLAVITSAEQNDFIFNLIRSQNTVTKWGAWIGIKKKVDGKFYWLDDTPVEGHYSSWAAGEPSGDGNCVQMYGTKELGLGKKWNDISCELGSHVTDAPVILCQFSL